MDKDLFWVSFFNVIKIALFVGLAIFFHQWWISLFAFPFFTNYRVVTTHKDDTEEHNGTI